MFAIEMTFPDGRIQRGRSRDTVLVIGKEPGCKVLIDGSAASKRHAELFLLEDRVFVRDLKSDDGIQVNGKRVDMAGPLGPDDVLLVASHAIRVRWSRAEEDVAQLTSAPQISASPRTQHAPRSVQAAASRREGVSPEAATDARRQGFGLSPLKSQMCNIRKVLHEQLVDAFGIRRVDVHRMADEELRVLTEKIVRDLIGRLPEPPPAIDHERLLAEVRDEAIGLGLLEPLLADASITEIMVNAADEIFVERSGQLQRLPLAFTSDRIVLGIIERIVAPVGRRIDESSPMVDARLKDGSRVNAIIPPLALKGPSLTIRKFSKRKLGTEDLLKFGSASPEMIDFLRVCVEQHKNIIISGGTGSGKTTLLNILSNFIPDGDRIVSIEDAAELQLHHPNLVSMESRPANLEGKGQITIRDLVKNALRMRPDRIVVGECRGGEALDMLQAMNTGHDGSLTTAHANTPRDMLSRLEVMVLMAGMDLPVPAIREQVSSAVDVIVQQSRLTCGARKITSIVEVTGIESGKIQLQEIFAYVQEGFDEHGKTLGYFTGRGCVPEFYEALAARGVVLDMQIFSPVARPPTKRAA